MAYVSTWVLVFLFFLFLPFSSNFARKLQPHGKSAPNHDVTQVFERALIRTLLFFKVSLQFPQIFL